MNVIIIQRRRYTPLIVQVYITIMWMGLIIGWLVGVYLLIKFNIIG